MYPIGFVDGTADYVRWMTLSGIHAYALSYPLTAIQVFFVSVVALDRAVVALVAFVRREGSWLAATMVAVDVAASWIGDWTRIHHTCAPNVLS